MSEWSPQSYAAAVYSMPRAELPLYVPGSAPTTVAKMYPFSNDPIRTMTPNEFNHYYTTYIKNTNQPNYIRYSVARILIEDIKRSNPLNYFIPDDIRELITQTDILQATNPTAWEQIQHELRFFNDYLRKSRPPLTNIAENFGTSLASWMGILQKAHERNWAHLSEAEIMYERDMVGKAKLIAQYQAEATLGWNVGQMVRKSQFVRDNIKAYLAQVILANTPMVKEFNAFQRQELQDFQDFLTKEINEGYISPESARGELKKFLGVIKKADDRRKFIANMMVANPNQHPLMVYLR